MVTACCAAGGCPGRRTQRTSLHGVGLGGKVQCQHSLPFMVEQAKAGPVHSHRQLWDAACTHVAAAASPDCSAAPACCSCASVPADLLCGTPPPGLEGSTPPPPLVRRRSGTGDMLRSGDCWDASLPGLGETAARLARCSASPSDLLRSTPGPAASGEPPGAAGRPPSPSSSLRALRTLAMLLRAGSPAGKAAGRPSASGPTVGGDAAAPAAAPAASAAAGAAVAPADPTAAAPAAAPTAAPTAAAVAGPAAELFLLRLAGAKAPVNELVTDLVRVFMREPPLLALLAASSGELGAATTDTAGLMGWACAIGKVNEGAADGKHSFCNHLDVVQHKECVPSYKANVRCMWLNSLPSGAPEANWCATHLSRSNGLSVALVLDALSLCLLAAHLARRRLIHCPRRCCRSCCPRSSSHRYCFG